MHTTYARLKGIEIYKSKTYGLSFFQMADFPYNEIHNYGFGHYGYPTGNGEFSGIKGEDSLVTNFEHFLVICEKDDLDK